MYYSKKMDPSKIVIGIVVVIALISLFSMISSFINTNESSDIKGGHRLVLVVSGSMEPTIAVNSLSLMEVCSFDEVNIGDIIMYKVPGNIDIAHRVVDKVSNEEEQYILTKGDNNRHHDNLYITPDMVNGRIIAIYNWTAPFISLIMAEPGMVDPIALGKVIIIAILVLGLLVMGLEYFGHKVSMIIKARDTSKDGVYNKKLEEYKGILQNRLKVLALIENLEKDIASLEGQLPTVNKSTKRLEEIVHQITLLKRKRLLARGKMLDEIDGFLKSSGDMQTALRKYRRLTSVKAECYKALLEEAVNIKGGSIKSGELAEIHNDKSTK